MNLRSKKKVSAQFNMSSMTDIVFLLLIFFMLLSTLVRTSGLELQLPKSSGTAKQDKAVAVTVNKKRKFLIENKEVPKKILITRLNKLLRDQKDPKILIQAEEGVPVEDLYYILDIAKSRGYKTVLATRPIND